MSAIPDFTRRDFLKLSAGVAVAARFAGAATKAPATAPVDPYVTCFYQFDRACLEALSARDALPNGENFVHYFTTSFPGMGARPELAKAVHACGKSFKFVPALDVHKYTGWMKADDAQLLKWAKEFRATQMGQGGADAWAFNEMPTTGAATPHLRETTARWVRMIHDPGDGPKFPCVFYFTERNTQPDKWEGDSDDFWAALNETCVLVVGEHYHSNAFVQANSGEKLTNHLFALPNWLMQSGKAPQIEVVQKKYAVLHSTYYGPSVTGWAGLEISKTSPAELTAYIQRTIDATRASDLGKKRIGFGPLVTKGQDPKMTAALAKALGADVKKSIQS